MANGVTRNALSEIQIRKEKATAENDVMKSYDKKTPSKIPLKNPTSNNHSK